MLTFSPPFVGVFEAGVLKVFFNLAGFSVDITWIYDF